MIVLRYLYLLALVAWLGGMFALAGMAAPSIFSALEHHASADGQALADAVINDLDRKFHMAAYLCGIVMLATLMGMRLLGPKPIHFAARFSTVAAMFAIAIYAGFSLTSEIGRRPTAPMILNMVGGLSLLYWEARE